MAKAPWIHLHANRVPTTHVPLAFIGRNAPASQRRYMCRILFVTGFSCESFARCLCDVPLYMYVNTECNLCACEMRAFNFGVRVCLKAVGTLYLFGSIYM